MENHQLGGVENGHTIAFAVIAHHNDYSIRQKILVLSLEAAAMLHVVPDFATNVMLTERSSHQWLTSSPHQVGGLEIQLVPGRCEYPLPKRQQQQGFPRCFRDGRKISASPSTPLLQSRWS